MRGSKILVTLFSTLFLGAAGAEAALQTSSWINYVDQNLQQVDQYGRGFQAISVFTYDFDANDNLGPARPWVTSTLSTLRADNSAPGRLVYVTVTNDIESNPPVNFSGSLIDGMLADPNKRAALIQQLVAVSADGDGIDIDFESLLASTHDNFTTFIQQLRAALPSGKKLAVTAQPKTSDAVGPRGEAIDWRAIAPYVDDLRVMIYYYSYGGSAPGPAATLAQTRAVTSFALSEVPASRLSMVLTEYGYDWPLNGGEGVLDSYQQAAATAQKFGATTLRDPTDQTLRYNYTDASGVAHQIWIDDDVALQAKISAIQSLGTSRISFWSLGTGDPNFLSYIAAQTGGSGPPPPASAPSLSSLSPDAATAGGPAFTLTLNGANFTADAAVRWNGSVRASSFISASQMTASITAADVAGAGTASVTVSNATGTSNALTFTISPASTGSGPSLASLSPASTPAGGSAFNLTVDGAGFASGSEVRWNATKQPSVLQGTTRLIAYVPASDIAAAGTATITVITAGGAVSNPATFTITGSGGGSNPPPAGVSIASLSPASAAAGGAAFNLTVDGVNFTSGSVVQFNGASRPGVLQGTTRLIVYIPPSDIAAAGTAKVDVFTSGAGTSNTLPFTITGSTGSTGGSNPVPTIATLTPSSDPPGGAAFNLTVDGANFVEGAVVRWNGLNRPGVLQGTSRLIVYIPASDIASSTVATVTVFNPAPGGGTSNALPFTVSPSAVRTNASSPLAAGAGFSLVDLYAFPNPSRRGQTVTIRLQAGAVDSVEVRVYDLAGRLINSGSPGSPTVLDDGNGKGSQLTYDYFWDVSNVGSGVYVYSVKAARAGETDVRKLGKVGVLK